MLTRVLLIGLIAGALSGVVAAAAQAFWVQPLITQAEASEELHVAPGHGGRTATGETVEGHEEEPPRDPSSRRLWTAVAVICTSIGYGLLASGAMVLLKVTGWRAGLALGVVGFVSVQLAPALGAPPQPPGLPSYDVHMRQLWWLLAAAGTVVASFIAFRAARQKSAALFVVATLVALLPHLARPALTSMGPSPSIDSLASSFVLASVSLMAVLWLSVGTLVGALSARMPPPT